jgi:hypothetical protein
MIVLSLHAVDRARELGSFGDAVEERDNGDLVGHGHVDAPEAERPDPSHGIPERRRLDLETDVAGVYSGCGERLLDHLLRRVSGNRLADHAE